MWHITKLLALIGVIVFAGGEVARDLGELITLERYASENNYASFAVDASQRKPAYQEFPPDAVIYSTSADVLKKQQELVRGEKDFLFANLTDLELQTYQKGALARSSKILAKGKNGSLFETPSGYYTIRGKESNHFSTIGKVWMPWSMHFFGNYFIHGWPYYPDGAPVAEAFSGGCIRLSDTDAKEIFTAAKVGMPVLVYSGTTTPPLQFTYFKKRELDQKLFCEMLELGNPHPGFEYKKWI